MYVAIEGKASAVVRIAVKEGLACSLEDLDPIIVQNYGGANNTCSLSNYHAILSCLILDGHVECADTTVNTGVNVYGSETGDGDLDS